MFIMNMRTTITLCAIGSEALVEIFSVWNAPLLYSQLMSRVTEERSGCVKLELEA